MPCDLPPLALTLLQQQNECTLIWNTRDGASTGAVVACVWHGGRLWSIAERGGRRVNALRRDPRASAVLSGKGVASGFGCSVTLRGHCEIIEDAATRGEIVGRLSRAVIPGSVKGAAIMAGQMDSPGIALIAFSPERCIDYDSAGALAMLDSL